MTKTVKYTVMQMIVVGLLLVNILLGVYIVFFKPSVYSLEAMKAGGRENMKMAKQLYTSDMYIQQQRTTLEQILNSINQAGIPAFDDSQLIMNDDMDIVFPELE